MQNLKLTILFPMLLLLSTHVNAQFGRLIERVKDEIGDEITREVTDAVAERIADEIANRAVKKVDNVLDSMFQSTYEKDSIDYEGLSRSYGDFLNAMNETADLPDQYQFDILLEIEMTDYNKSKSTMNMLLSKNQSIIGMEQVDQGEKSDIVVIDLENDIVAVYNMKEKVVQALPNMMSLGATLVQASNEDMTDFKFERTSQTKRILGYNTTMFKSETDKETSDVYLAENFPINWKDIYTGRMISFLPEHYVQQMESVNGFMLYSETSYKSNGKTSRWETKNITEDAFIFDNTEFVKSSMVRN